MKPAEIAPAKPEPELVDLDGDTEALLGVWLRRWVPSFFQPEAEAELEAVLQGKIPWAEKQTWP